MDAPSPRSRLGAYEPLLALAAGGMARVYLARQLGAAGFERLVVIKRVHRHLLEHRSFHDALYNEARIASHIHHPNVVAVTDVLDHGGELLLVMPYIESAPLSALLQRARREGVTLPVPVVVRIVADVLAGLHAAHEAVDMRGRPLAVVHRDVSPENVIVGVDGVSRLIDFGVAKAAHALEDTGASLRGKYAYMAPEQVAGEEVDRRADVFAAGIVLFEALTGTPLFAGETSAEALHKIREMPVPPPSTRRPDLSPAVDEVVLRALARAKSERFATAHELLEALERAARPAPAQEVARLLEQRFGAKLAARREQLRAILDGELEATARLSRVSSDDTGAAPDAAFGPDAASSRRPPPGSDVTARRRSEVMGVSTTRTAPAIPARAEGESGVLRRRLAWLGALSVLALAALAAATRARGSGVTTPTPTPTPTTTPTPTPTTTDLEVTAVTTPAIPSASASARRAKEKPAAPRPAASRELQPDPY